MRGEDWERIGTVIVMALASIGMILLVTAIMSGCTTDTIINDPKPKWGDGIYKFE